MSELISKKLIQDALIEKISRLNADAERSAYTLMEFIRFKRYVDGLTPVADRPQGEWIDAGQYPFDKCSICGQTVDSYDEWNYCPNCGARMVKDDA